MVARIITGRDPDKLAAFAAKCAADPFVSEMMRWAAARGGRAEEIREPWMAIAEARMFAFAASSGILLQAFTDDSVAPSARALLGRVFLGARAFLWRVPQIELAASYPLPPHVVAKPDAPFDTTWHCWSCAGASQHGWETRGLLVHVQDGRIIAVVACSREFDGAPGIFTHVVPIGSRWPDDSDDPEANGQILRLFAFLNSKAASSTKCRAPRAMRRRAERAGAPINKETDVVNVIDLRPREADERVGEGDGDQRTYNHRFWVRGHIRAQWYPSLNGHRLIYVEPFVKGPADAPFAAQVYDVKR